jgi:hypothetical protein
VCRNDRIRFGHLLSLGQWNVRKDLTGGFGAHPFQSLIRNQFCHLVELHLSPCVLRSGHNGFRHLINVAVHAVENHLDFRSHGLSPL